jgi:hypothetical protein
LSNKSLEYTYVDSDDEYIIESNAKSLPLSREVDKFVDKFYEYANQSKFTSDQINNIFEVLSMYPGAIHRIYDYCNMASINPFINLKKPILQKILYHLIHSDYVETNIKDNYEHPFDMLYYRLNDNYQRLLMPRKVKYINPVMLIYNILIAHGRIPNYPKNYRTIPENNRNEYSFNEPQLHHVNKRNGKSRTTRKTIDI